MRFPLDLDIFLLSIRIMPWVNKLPKRLALDTGREPGVDERSRVEAGVEQVQDGVFDAADVLVDRHEVAGDGGIERPVLRPRVTEAKEVPRRVDEGVHGVGLASRRPTTAGAR